MDDFERLERRLRLADLRVLLAVSRSGSMHKAAAQLHTSQPAISRSIADLEQLLGVRLFDRTRRGVEPTPYGRAIIDRSITVFDELRHGLKDVQYLMDPTVGQLSIGLTEAVAAGPGFATINHLTRLHPGVIFDVVTGGWDVLAQLLAGRKIELIMAGVIGPVPEDFAVETLALDPLVVAAGLQNPWTRRRKIKLADLTEEPWTLPSPDGPSGALAAEAFRASGLQPPRTAVITVSINLRSRLLATGRFLTMLPINTLRLPGGLPFLKALPVALPGTQRTVAIVSLRHKTLSPLAERFASTARKIARPSSLIN